MANIFTSRGRIWSKAISNGKSTGIPCECDFFMTSFYLHT